MRDLGCPTDAGDGRLRTYELDPLPLIGAYHPADSLRGGSPEANAAITRGVLAGENGAARDVVLLNAAAGIVAGGKADDLNQGFELAKNSIDSGQAAAKLQALIEHTK